MDGTPFREVEEVLDRHARRLAGELGRLLMDVGRALRDEAAADTSSARTAPRAEPTREDLYREAARLGVKGRSRMTKDELRDAVARAARRR
jgi:hypothetical protein